MALVAQAAHELRGPLSAALLGLHGVVADAAAARRVAAVELELRRAGLALDDLGAAPHGRRAPECAEPVELRALLADAVEAWRPLASALASELLFDPAGARLVVHADPLRLTQAVGNLVLNALEHGGGPVRVRAHATVRTSVSRCATTGRGCPRPWRRWPATPGTRPAAGTAWRSPPAWLVATAAGCSPRRSARAPAWCSSCRAPTRAPRDPGARAAPPVAPGDRAVSRRRRAAVLLGLALVLGGLAASDVARREAAVRAQLGPPVEVVVARGDLAAGRTLGAADLALRRVPARYAPAGAATVPGEPDRAGAGRRRAARRLCRGGAARDASPRSPGRRSARASARRRWSGSARRAWSSPARASTCS